MVISKKNLPYTSKEIERILQLITYGLSSRQIAKIEGRSASSIRTRISRTKKTYPYLIGISRYWRHNRYKENTYYQTSLERNIV